MSQYNHVVIKNISSLPPFGPFDVVIVPTGTSHQFFTERSLSHTFLQENTGSTVLSCITAGGYKTVYEVRLEKNCSFELGFWVISFESSLFKPFNFKNGY
jgi:hypothetical protein